MVRHTCVHMKHRCENSFHHFCATQQVCKVASHCVHRKEITFNTHIHTPKTYKTPTVQHFSLKHVRNADRTHITMWAQHTFQRTCNACALAIALSHLVQHIFFEHTHKYTVRENLLPITCCQCCSLLWYTALPNLKILFYFFQMTPFAYTFPLTI